MVDWRSTTSSPARNVPIWFKDISTNPLILLLIVNFIFFIADMFVDSPTATLLLVPIVAPPVVTAGVDPIHLGIIVVFSLMIGTITPPFGLSLFLLSSMTGVSMMRLLKAMLPFYTPLLVTLAILTLFPALVLFIPQMLREGPAITCRWLKRKRPFPKLVTPVARSRGVRCTRRAPHVCAI